MIRETHPSYSNGPGRQDLLRQHEELPDEIIRRGASCAAALAADEDLPSAAGFAEERNLRDRESDDDRRLARDFIKYHVSIRSSYAMYWWQVYLLMKRGIGVTGPGV